MLVAIRGNSNYLVQLLYSFHVEKSQNFVIFVVLTVFGVCGVAILLLLRPVKNEEGEKSNVSW